jgi:hypothetical protein
MAKNEDNRILEWGRSDCSCKSYQYMLIALMIMYVLITTVIPMLYETIFTAALKRYLFSVNEDALL